MKGFYKGLAAYLIHVTPNICIVFLMYEKFAPIPNFAPSSTSSSSSAPPSSPTTNPAVSNNHASLEEQRMEKEKWR